jgi:hypothetical protein
VNPLVAGSSPARPTVYLYGLGCRFDDPLTASAASVTCSEPEGI